MSFFGNLFQWGKLKEASPKAASTSAKEKYMPPTRHIRVRQQTRHHNDVKRWREALNSAESEHSPTRIYLNAIYRDIVLDNHLSALMRNRKQRILGMPGMLYTSKEPDYDASKMFNSQWFSRFVECALDAIFYGYTVFELEVSAFELRGRKIDNANINPELGLFVPDSLDHQRGTLIDEIQSYDNMIKGDAWQLFCFGEKYDFGLLNSAAPLVLMKKNTMSRWAEYVDIYGLPLRVAKADTNNTELSNQIADDLREMGSTGVAVLPLNMEIEFINDPARSGAESVLDKHIERINKELSKLFVGATMILDDGGSYTQAAVHDDIFDDLTRADKRYIEQIVNQQLLPKLVNWGFLAPGYVFELEREVELPFTQKMQGYQILGQLFDLDPQQIYEETGIKVKPKGSTNVEIQPANQ